MIVASFSPPRDFLIPYYSSGITLRNVFSSNERRILESSLLNVSGMAIGRGSKLFGFMKAIADA
jgi:hypothetical protein